MYRTGMGFQLIATEVSLYLGCIMESWHIEGRGSVQLLEVGRLQNDLTEWKWQQKGMVQNIFARNLCFCF